MKHLGSIERLRDGGAVLHYPGYEPRYFLSANAAFNQRKRIELGIAVRKTTKREDNWTPKEEAKVREIWGRVPRAAYTSLLPGRTYYAIKAFCKNRKIRAHPNRSIPKPWTLEQIRIVVENDRKTACSLLSGVKNAEQIGRLALKLGLKVFEMRKSWSQSEIELLRSAERSIQRLIRHHNRTPTAIGHMQKRIRLIDFKTSSMHDAVIASTAHLPDQIRQDVQGDVMIQLLAREIEISGLHDAVKKAASCAWGPRYLSLDAPIADGAGMTWIDTIESDRPHF